jgi:hypothetical protein
LRRHGALESRGTDTALVLGTGHVILLLSGHEESLLVLLLQQHKLHRVILESVIALRRARGTGRHAWSRTVAGEDLMLAVKARLSHGRAMSARVHTLGGSSVTIQSHSVLLGQALGIYLDVLLLRILAGLRKVGKLVARHAIVHSTCRRTTLVQVHSGYSDGGDDVPSMRGRLFGDGAFSLGPGDCGRWPFMSMLEPSRCICAAAIMAGVILLPMLAMGPFPLLRHVSLHT